MIKYFVQKINCIIIPHRRAFKNSFQTCLGKNCRWFNLMKDFYHISRRERHMMAQMTYASINIVKQTLIIFSNTPFTDGL